MRERGFLAVGKVQSQVRLVIAIDQTTAELFLFCFVGVLVE